MTDRARLNRRMRWLIGAVYVGASLCFVGIFLGQPLGQDAMLAVSLPGFALAFMAAMVVQSGGLRCSRCRSNLGPMIMYRGALLRVDPRLRYCPYCGANFDEQLPVEEESEQGT